MGTFKMTNGERVKKSVIDRRVRDSKEKLIENQVEEHGYNFCQDCGVNSSQGPLDCSHEQSVDECQKKGESEKAWDLSNMKVRCRKCHQKKDKLQLQWTIE